MTIFIIDCYPAKVRTHLFSNSKQKNKCSEDVWLRPSYVGPCLHGMTRQRFAYGGDNLHLWKVTANTYWISNREQPTRGGPPAWGLGWGLTASHRINVKHGSLGRRRRWWENNIRMDLRDVQVGWKNVDWMYLAQWRAFANTVMDVWVP